MKNFLNRLYLVSLMTPELAIPIGDPDNIYKIQTSLNSIFKWVNQNNTEFNTDKFKCVKYGRNEDLKCLSHYTNQDNKLLQEKGQRKGS